VGVKVPWYVAWPLLLLVVYGVLAYFASRSVFYPMRHPTGWWHLQEQVGAQDVWLETGDGVKLHGWMVERKELPWVTLFLHGNAGNVTHRATHIETIVAAGSSILVPDYRGFGKSEGAPSESGLYADALAGYEYLLAQGFQASQIVVHGESLGTVAAVHLAAHRPCAGVVLEAPLTSARDIAGRVLPLLGPWLIWGYDSTRLIHQVRAPILILHGDRDEIIPFDMGQALYEAAPSPKRFQKLAGAGHNDILHSAGAEYTDALRSFYRSLQPAASSTP
jgi:uncharacterized protein